MDFAELLSSLHLFPASGHNEFCATYVHLTWRYTEILGRIANAYFYLACQVTPINCSRLVQHANNPNAKTEPEH